MKRPDPAELAIFNALFASVADEMGVTLGRTAHSPNIKERRDYSCAVFDHQGRLVAQAAHIPVHLGAMPTAVRAAMAAAHPDQAFAPGDLVILNDPYLGGTHLPDITMVSPVFVRAGSAGGTGFSLSNPGRGRDPSDLLPPSSDLQDTLAGFVASRAHHADVGGMSPGSMPLAEELLQEGIVIPPIKLYESGRLNRAAFDLLLRNMRNPEERKGDLDAQTAAQRVGDARFREILERYGLDHVRRQTRAVMDYAERMTRDAISHIPDGVYEFEDFLDDDGATGEPVPIRLRLTIDGGTMHCDFTGSAEERPTSVNAVAAVTHSAVYYVVRCLLDESVPSNDGCFRPVSFTLPERSVVNASPPRPVAAGNVETSQRVVDVVLGALAQALLDRIPAASSGSMNNVSIGGTYITVRPVARGDSHGREPVEGQGPTGSPASNLQAHASFAYYETVAGGAGAAPDAGGLSAVHTHMTNTMNTPVEALELAYPFRVVEYAVRKGSGGPGRHRGGDGVRRTWEFLVPASVSLLTERRLRAAWGLAGGHPGRPGRNLVSRAHPTASPGKKEEGKRKKTGLLPSSSFLLPPEELPPKTNVRVQPGDRLTIETPGGGGWGEPDP